MKTTTAPILLLISIGLFYTFTSPHYRDVEDLRLTAGEYQNVLQNISEIAETRDRLLVSYEEIPKSEIDRLSKVLPDSIDTVRLAVDLDTIASRYGIFIKNVKVDTGAGQNSTMITLPESAKPYEKVVVSFSFVSNYQNFRKFLEDLEKSLRIMNVKAMTFQSSEAGLYDHQLSVETYWLR